MQTLYETKIATDDAAYVPSPTIQNIVATIRMGALPSTFREIIEAFPFADYNSTRFAAAIIKLRSPPTTCSVFVSGKAVITGSKTETQARQAAVRLVVLLRRLGLDVCYSHFRIENIVTAVYCPFYIDLQRTHERIGGRRAIIPRCSPVWCTSAPSRIVSLCCVLRVESALSADARPGIRPPTCGDRCTANISRARCPILVSPQVGYAI